MKDDELVLPLVQHERLWLQEVYNRTLQGKRFTFKEIHSLFHADLPRNWRPSQMDRRLIAPNGEELRILGVVAIDGNTEILNLTDRVMNSIKELLLIEANRVEVAVGEISERTKIQQEQISLILKLIRELGSYYQGANSIGTTTHINTVSVSGSDETYYLYQEYPGIRKILEVHEYAKYKQPILPFTIEEEIITSNRIDLVLADLQSLKAGQEVIYNELNEMKTLFSLGKKNWRKLLFGKLGEMIIAGIIDDTLAKRIGDILNPMLDNLLSK